MCVYCDEPQTEPVMDFAGKPSCEACFDAAAYKSRGIPPSPHLSQSAFAPAAPSKWGGSVSAKTSTTTTPKANALVIGKSGPAAANPWSKSGATRLENERGKSPLVASFDELSHKLREAGLLDKPRSAGLGIAATPVKAAESAKAGSGTKPFVPPSTGAGPRSYSPTSQPWSRTRTPSPTKLSTVTVPSPSGLTRSPGGPLQPISSPQASLRANSQQDASKAPLKPKTASAAEETCTVCNLALGYGELMQLTKTGEMLHRACFVCAGCNKQLDAGKHVEAEERVWHHACAPAPMRYRSIVTSLQEPVEEDGSGEASSPHRSPVEVDENEICGGCSKTIGVGRSITVPRFGKTFHQTCFKCSGCQLALSLAGQRSFVEKDGKPYHDKCAPAPTQPDDKARVTYPLRASTSRTSIAPTQNASPRYQLPSPSSSPIRFSASSSIFATRSTPPAKLGGLLICAGCSVRATEKETTNGPLGRRYHKKCLVCGLCSKELDSETRLSAGQLRCESCRKLESRRSYHASSGAMASPMRQ